MPNPQLLARPVDPSLQFARQTPAITEDASVAVSLSHLPQFLEKGARFFIQRRIAGSPAFGAVPIQFQRMLGRSDFTQAQACRFRHPQATLPSRLGR